MKSDLRKLDGVQEVALEGDYHQEFQVHIDPQRLRDTGISFAEVAKAIADANVKIPSGRYRQQGHNTLLDTGQVFDRQQQVLDVAVRRDGDGNFIRVRDLATLASLSHREPDLISTVNGQSTVKLKVKKQDAANAITIAERVKQEVERFKPASSARRCHHGTNQRLHHRDRRLDPHPRRQHGARHDPGYPGAVDHPRLS